MVEEGPLKASELIVEASRRLLQPPFLSLLVLNLFVSTVAASFAEQIDEISIFSSVALAVVAAYLQIAVILAASEPEPEGSADHWIKAALKRRCFWRFAFASLFSFILVAAGLLALVIPGFILGAYVGMGPIAAVVERARAGESLRRSAELSVKGRRAVGTIFGLFVVVPNGALQVALYLAPKAIPLGLWIGLELATVILFLIALIALTRAFVSLGGRLEPLPAKGPP